MMKTKISGIPGILNQVEALQIYLRKAGLQQYIPLSHYVSSILLYSLSNSNLSSSSVGS